MDERTTMRYDPAWNWQEGPIMLFVCVTNEYIFYYGVDVV